MFRVKRWGALLLLPIISVIMYTLGNIYYGLLGGMIFLGIGMLFGALIANIMLKNPFTSMIEGKGLLCLDINSTGVITPFLVRLDKQYITGRIKKNIIKDIFNRKSIYNLAPLKEAEKPLEQKEDGGIKIDISNEEYNRARFGLYHYPVMIYNGMIQSLITKDFLSNRETEIFAEHGVLYLNRKMEELTSVVRDFGRHVVETLKPRGNIFNSWITWVVIVFLLIAGFIFFGPAILDAISGFSSSAAGKATAAIQSTGPSISPPGG